MLFCVVSFFAIFWQTWQVLQYSRTSCVITGKKCPLIISNVFLRAKCTDRGISCANCRVSFLYLNGNKICFTIISSKVYNLHAASLTLTKNACPFLHFFEASPIFFKHDRKEGSASCSKADLLYWLWIMVVGYGKVVGRGVIVSDVDLSFSLLADALVVTANADCLIFLV